MRSTAKKESEAPYISFVPSALISARNQGLALRWLRDYPQPYISWAFFGVAETIFFCVNINMNDIKLKRLSEFQKVLDYLNSLDKLNRDQIKLKSVMESEIKKLQEDLDKNK